MATWAKKLPAGVRDDRLGAAHALALRPGPRRGEPLGPEVRVHGLSAHPSRKAEPTSKE
ncbi:hypothetical protein GCM10019016_052690 [Streptomyces prasinosporus]|uniref:Uncharacterized protein n=1 Tax=Streptomyces prasinosporus TaxID=68256 RepID=A0ABP6TUY8_9ACTN